MSTLKSLSDLVPELISYIKVKQEHNLVANRKLMDIYQGNLLSYVEESLKLELNERAFARCKERIPPINVLTKVVEKLSRVYVEPAVRDGGENKIDAELLSYYENKLDLNTVLSTSNELLNLHKYFALEPYIDNGIPCMRVLPADKFIVWSDNVLNPNKMSVFIKFMGSIQKVGIPVDKKASNVIRDVGLFHIYSDAEFMIVDADGEIKELRPNPFGVIPFVYCNSNSFDLMPNPSSDMFSMSILIPKLLADLNFATKFQSHAIVYLIDGEPNNLDSNADAVWVINSGADGKVPQIGSIKPEVDIDKVITLINSEMMMWLESLGIKNNGGGATIDKAASGVSKLIDEGDASAVTRKQITMYRGFESSLWSLIKVMHGYWIGTQQLVDLSSNFSNDFKVAVKFAEHKVVIDPKTVLEELKLQFDLNLITPKMALFKLNPDFTEEQIDKILAEIAEFKANDNQLTQVDGLFNHPVVDPIAG